jgi:hypothetical protein
MKGRIALLALAAAAGVFASIAVAKPPAGHGNPHDQTTAAAGTTTIGTTGTTTTTPGHGRGHGDHHGQTTTTTTTTTAPKKVLVCHKVGNGKYVLVSVSAHSALARGKHGDVPATDGKCPGPTQGHPGTTTGQTTTAATTTS